MIKCNIKLGDIVHTQIGDRRGDSHKQDQRDFDGEDG